MAEDAQDNPLGAVSDYNAALHHDPHNVIAYRRRADARVKLGNLAEALKDYATYLQLGVLQSVRARAEVEALIGQLRQRLNQA
jgi:tetratricopeptide (TPR) repeat protein